MKALRWRQHSMRRGGHLNKDAHARRLTRSGRAWTRVDYGGLRSYFMRWLASKRVNSSRSRTMVRNWHLVSKMPKTRAAGIVS